MTDYAIKINNLTKTYNLYDKPFDRVKEAFHPFRKQYHTLFYALNNINMEIKKGETVGIIGKNGAGKSTILKIIAGVLSATSGEVNTIGKIASLLELGAGFNPEMTGIENIYLNGTIMGYSKQAIDERLTAIIEFADIGDFIYQQVKLYSSGMFARLAFAVAINVEPDILIIDEALSVGDAPFQRKCYNKFKILQDKGTTILFVSHDLYAVKTYTQRAYYFKEGICVCHGTSGDVINKYMQDVFPTQDKATKEIKIHHIEQDNNKSKDTLTIYKWHNAKSFGQGHADFEKIIVHGLNYNTFKGGEKVTFEIYINWHPDKVKHICHVENLKENIIVGMYIEDVKYNQIFAFNTFLSGHMINIDTGKNIVIFEIVMPVLAPGDYFLSPSIALGEHRVHTQLKWVDGFGIIKSLPDNPDFLGMVEFTYTTKEG